MVVSCVEDRGHFTVGTTVGRTVSTTVGRSVGTAVGTTVGTTVGRTVGTRQFDAEPTNRCLPKTSQSSQPKSQAPTSKYFYQLLANARPW